ncbi:MAG: hypothetical protein KDA22_16435 [Phycisphaerales bacterium]|nr:hypothetical protein [Phycisphaerales bacterium]
MICQIEGDIVAVRDAFVELRCDAVVYELLVPACDLMRLAGSVGETARFHTVHYLESQSQGATFFPRLVGFSTRSDLEFFLLLTSVKGIGNRKALRSLQMPIPDVAAAIAARDIALLTTLPEIGRKTAETIVLELRDKVDRFVVDRRAGAAVPAGGPAASLMTDAVTVLAMLGESRTTARQLVERALAADPGLESADAMVTAALRIKEVGGG